MGVQFYTDKTESDQNGVTALSERLLELYPGDHEAVIYQAAPLPIYETRIERVKLSHLHAANLNVYTTLYVPPARAPEIDPRFVARLRLEVREGRLVPGAFSGRA